MVSAFSEFCGTYNSLSYTKNVKQMKLRFSWLSKPPFNLSWNITVALTMEDCILGVVRREKPRHSREQVGRTSSSFLDSWWPSSGQNFKSTRFAFSFFCQIFSTPGIPYFPHCPSPPHSAYSTLRKCSAYPSALSLVLP